MQVKQRLKINAAISVTAAVAIVLVFSLALYRLNKANNLAKISGDIILNAFERVTLRNDYLQNNNERAKKQWFARQEAIGKILEVASKTFQDPQDKKNIEALFKDHESIMKIFSAIVQNRENTKSNAKAAAISKEVEDRLISQLNIKVYETVLHGRGLLESSREARTAAIRFAGEWTAAVLVFLIGAIIMNSRTMTRAITDRVKKLRDGALVIGGGDLDHRIDTKGDDEFAELSGAFNAMTAKLKTSTEKLKTSYRDLNNEVEERKRAEEALIESEVRYGNLFNSIDEGFCIIEVIFDAEGRPVDYRFIEVNAAFEKQTGLHEAEGKSMRDIAPAHEAHWFEIYGKIAVTGEPERFVNEAKALNRWYDVYAFRVGKPENRRVAIVFNDITERKRVEEALLKAYDELEARVEDRTKELRDAERSLQKMNVSLEKRVAERTAELKAANTFLYDSRLAALNLMEDSLAARKQAEEVNVELQQEVIERKKAEDDVLKLSEDMAARNVELEAVNRELEAFIYSVSHDLRAPIRNMSGFARIIVEDYIDKLDEQGQDYLDRILKSSAKSSRLIDDLLYLSKISRHEITRTKVDMSKIAHSIVAELRESAPERRLDISIKEGMTAFADPRLIEIVVTNLLGNAWKFTSRTDKARVEFGTVENPPLHPSREETVYYIKDNGVGFDATYADKMFLPFHRLHSDSEFEGTGIGLAIVERIIHRHGGRIWVEGEVGKGATVYFTFGQGSV